MCPHKIAPPQKKGPPVYIYIYRESVKRERERHGKGKILGSSKIYSGGKKYFQEDVGSARSQLFMPGLHHAHTLQQLRSEVWTLTPGRVFKTSISLHLLGQQSHVTSKQPTTKE